MAVSRAKSKVIALGHVGLASTQTGWSSAANPHSLYRYIEGLARAPLRGNRGCVVGVAAMDDLGRETGAVEAAKREMERKTRAE